MNGPSLIEPVPLLSHMGQPGFPHKAAGPATPVPLLRWTHGLVNRLVTLLDWLLMTGIGWLLARPLAHLPATITSLQGLVIAGLQATLFIGVIRRLGGYRVERYEQPVQALLDLAGAYAVVLAFSTLLFVAFVPETLIRPGWVLLWEGAMFLSLVINRAVAREFVGLVDRRALLRRNVVVIGSGDRAREMLTHLKQDSMAGRYRVLGVFDPSPDGCAPDMVAGQQVLGTIDTLRSYAQSHSIDIILVALPWSESADIFRVIEEIQWISADVVVPFDPIGYQHFSASVVWVGGKAGLQLLYRPFKGTQGLLKIAEDYVVGALGLLIASPIMLLAALAIRLESRGPIMFRQSRSGFNNKPFMIYKLRTMTHDPSDDGSVGTRGPNDPRITRVGRVLRRLSVDEMPQLINVLRGEMSVVGPRPYVPNMLVGTEQFNEAVREYAARHRIKPGITGFAQANGLRGGALRSVEQARRSVAMDMYYISNWSLWFDVKIMARTLLVGMFGRNVF
jgi:Undecaprenyl-phosphate glucose phosphotransferase